MGSNGAKLDSIHIQEYSDMLILNESCNLTINQQLYSDKSLHQTRVVNIDRSSDNYYVDIDHTEKQVVTNQINEKQFDVSTISKISNTDNLQLNTDQDLKQTYKVKKYNLNE